MDLKRREEYKKDLFEHIAEHHPELLIEWENVG